MATTIDVTVRVPDLDGAPLLMETAAKALCESMGDPKEANKDGSPDWRTLTGSEHRHRALAHMIAAWSADEDGWCSMADLRNGAVRALMALHRAQEQDGNHVAP